MPRPMHLSGPRKRTSKVLLLILVAVVLISSGNYALAQWRAQPVYEFWDTVVAGDFQKAYNTQTVSDAEGWYPSVLSFEYAMRKLGIPGAQSLKIEPWYSTKVSRVFKGSYVDAEGKEDQIYFVLKKEDREWKVELVNLYRESIPES